jgi:hypothetical protein
MKAPVVDQTIVCVLCKQEILPSPLAPIELTIFDTFDDGTAYHAACWDAGKRVGDDR